jgi:regulator of PEP synthase PpsR (kinase-PPPase family)
MRPPQHIHTGINRASSDGIVSAAHAFKMRCFLSLLLLLGWPSSLYNNAAEAFVGGPLSEAPSNACTRRQHDITVLLSSPTSSGSGENNSDDELLRLIRGPLGAETERSKIRPKAIMILSDTTGVTAKTAVEKGLAQFNGCDDRFFTVGNTDLNNSDSDNDSEGDEACETMNTKTYPFVRTEEDVAAILKNAQGWTALVVFTMADPALRESTRRMCEVANVQYVDLLGHMFDVMSGFFQRQPLGAPMITRTDRPNRRRALSDSYYRRIEAVEYTLKCDDGMSPKNWKEADVVLLGVSRTGKTPLSVILAQTMGLKVANIPLVVDLAPNKQLFEPEMDPRRIFCLTLNQDDLQRIRKNRLSRELKRAGRRQAASSTYADRDYLYRDLENARAIAVKHGYTIIDVTGRAVEETASLISSVLNERFPDTTN